MMKLNPDSVHVPNPPKCLLCNIKQSTQTTAAVHSFQITDTKESIKLKHVVGRKEE